MAERDNPPGLGLFTDNRSLHGALVRVWYRNSESSFAAGQFRVADTGEHVAVVGTLGELSEGQPVQLTGHFEDHPRYGRRFVVEQLEIDRPDTPDAVEAYLASGFVKGVGPALAKRIVKALGPDTLNTIEEKPQKLLQVRGIGAKKAEEISEAVRGQMALREVMLFLSGNDLPLRLAQRILNTYGEQAPRLLRNNPYRLADELVGVGFKRADEVAEKLGIDRQSRERSEAGLLHTLNQAASRDGHCCLPKVSCLEEAGQLLGVDEPKLEEALQALIETRHVVVEPLTTDVGVDPEEFVFPLTLHVTETKCARALREHAAAPPIRFTDEPDAAIDLAVNDEMPAAQRAALLTALTTPLCVITGGPGVGKTTIIRTLADIVTGSAKSIALAAPTGRAAKRMQEATGRKASTIHRLLEFQPGTNRFIKNERNQIDADVVVIDESSMLDLSLAYALCRAIAPGTHLVLVGDADQLPSVGPGRVLEDLIRSASVPIVRLTEVFRQQQGSRIIEGAHRVLRGEMPDLPPPAPGELGDFYLVEQDDPDRSLDTIVRTVSKRMPEVFGLDPFEDVQVLCPMYRGPLGVDRINRALGDALVSGGPEIVRGTRRFRRGDKVLQVRNDYDLELFNGDPGRIVDLDPEKLRITVRFGTRHLDLAAEAIDGIVPAYGITVHRAQGSEYTAVVLACDKSHFLMLHRRLLYTAVTRAKRLLVVVGSRWALERAVQNDAGGRRFSGLRQRLSVDAK